MLTLTPSVHRLQSNNSRNKRLFSDKAIPFEGFFSGRAKIRRGIFWYCSLEIKGKLVEGPLLLLPSGWLLPFPGGLCTVTGCAPVHTLFGA